MVQLTATTSRCRAPVAREQCEAYAAVACAKRMLNERPEADEVEVSTEGEAQIIYTRDYFAMDNVQVDIKEAKQLLDEAGAHYQAGEYGKAAYKLVGLETVAHRLFNKVYEKNERHRAKRAESPPRGGRAA